MAERHRTPVVLPIRPRVGSSPSYQQKIAFPMTPGAALRDGSSRFVLDLTGRFRTPTIRLLDDVLIIESHAINQVFKALSDPTRREILRLLAAGEKTAGELAERFDMAKPSVSHHFAVLKQAELVHTRREGQKIFYSLNTTVAQDAMAWLWDLFGRHDTRKRRAIRKADMK
jgi:DNA-binding transcriptional ArsR family regulator